jgi:hypothetical protein
MVIAVARLGLIGRGAVMALRRDGVGRAKAERGPSAPWLWSGIGLLIVAGLLLIPWVIALDS